MKRMIPFWMLLLFIAAGCATTTPQQKKAIVWETKDISRAYEVLGPVSVSEQIKENSADTIQGLAGFISKDGRVSGQIPEDMKAALEVKREKYKEMIFDKLADKAKNSYDADAVIGAEYLYVPPYATFSDKATVTAKGMMVKYK